VGKWLAAPSKTLAMRNAPSSDALRAWIPQSRPQLHPQRPRRRLLFPPLPLPSPRLPRPSQLVTSLTPSSLKPPLPLP
jgi:hypothetical protein